MGNEDSEHLSDEYLTLWREHGVDGLNARKPPRPGTAKAKAKPLPAKAAPPGNPALKSLEDIQRWIGDCRRCGLCEQRNKIVFGSGSPAASSMHGQYTAWKRRMSLPMRCTDCAAPSQNRWYSGCPAPPSADT